MKVTFKIIKMCKPADFYRSKAESYYIVKRRGWFGWKTLEEVMTMEWGSHDTFSYWPGDSKKFDYKENAQEFLLTHYGRREAHTCPS